MTTPTADAVWGIRWEVPVLPDNDPVVPVQPQQPDLPYDEPYLGEWEAYNTAITQWYADIVALAAMHPEWWKPTVTTFSSEAAARSELVGKQEINAGNPFTRNTELVWSAPTVWTATE